MVANLWVAASDGDLEVVKKYIESGNFTPESKDPNGYTPIHAAASYGHIELLKYLVLDKKGNVNVQDEDGDTPLHHCDELNSIQALIEQFEADYTIKNSEGLTIFDIYDGEDPKVFEYFNKLNNNNSDEDQQRRSFDINETLNSTLKGLLNNMTPEDRNKVTLKLENVKNEEDLFQGEEERSKLKQMINDGNGDQLQEFLINAIQQKVMGDNENINAEETKKRRI